MLIHYIKYAMKTMLRNKTALIWTLLFPIALGTFMNMAFGKIYEDTHLFKGISVAIVKNVENSAFETMVEELSKEGENQLLSPVYLSEEEAKKALEEEKIRAIIYLNSEINMKVNANSYEVTMVESILNEYKKQEKILTEIAINNPKNLEEAIGNLKAEKVFYTSKNTSDGNQDVMTNYFYAIFAMSCLFASFGAIEKIGKMQGNVCPLGMRRCLAPNSKMIGIIAEFLSMLIFQIAVEIFALIYFVMIGVDFGNKYPQMIAVLILGSCIGIAFGIIIGSISKLSEGMKSVICVSTSMIFSVMSDLCANGVKDAIEHTVPIINRLNPAALISDAFYALNVFDTNARYLEKISILGIMTVILLFISYQMLRRNKYASL